LFAASFGDDFIRVEDELGLVGLAFEVGELVVAAAGPFGDARAWGGLDVEASVE